MPVLIRFVAQSVAQIAAQIVAQIDTLNEWVGRAVSWLAVVMVVNVFVVVVLRYAFSLGWVWMQEAYVWSHAVIFMLAAGYSLLHDQHVRIDLIYRTAGSRYKALVNATGCVCLAFPFLYALMQDSLPFATRSWINLEHSAEAGGLPGVFLLKSVIPVFCILFGLQFLSLFLKSVAQLISRDSLMPTEGGS